MPNEEDDCTDGSDSFVATYFHFAIERSLRFVDAKKASLNLISLLITHHILIIMLNLTLSLRLPRGGHKHSLPGAKSKAMCNTYALGPLKTTTFKLTCTYIYI